MFRSAVPASALRKARPSPTRCKRARMDPSSSHLAMSAFTLIGSTPDRPLPAKPRHPTASSVHDALRTLHATLRGARLELIGRQSTAKDQSVVQDDGDGRDAAIHESPRAISHPRPPRQPCSSPRIGTSPENERGEGVRRQRHTSDRRVRDPAGRPKRRPGAQRSTPAVHKVAASPPRTPISSTSQLGVPVTSSDHPNPPHRSSVSDHGSADARSPDRSVPSPRQPQLDSSNKFQVRQKPPVLPNPPAKPQWIKVLWFFLSRKNSSPRPRPRALHDLPVQTITTGQVDRTNRWPAPPHPSSSAT